jgi:hypothetical protein
MPKKFQVFFKYQDEGKQDKYAHKSLPFFYSSADCKSKPKWRIKAKAIFSLPTSKVRCSSPDNSTTILRPETRRGNFASSAGKLNRNIRLTP